jgi:hypothetical protein
LPLLPPRTPNVTFPRPAKPLEFNIREEATPNTQSKSGKNGNVHHPSQHCRMGNAATESDVALAWIVGISSIHADLALPLAFMPRSPRMPTPDPNGSIFASPPRQRKVALPWGT